MSLGRKVLDPVKVVLRWDPAIDHEKCDYDKYEEYYDYEKLKFKKGQTATVFVCKQLTHRQRVDLEARTIVVDRTMCAIRYCLTEVHDYIIERADGSSYSLRQPEIVDGEIKEAWIEEANLSSEDLLTIFVAITAISEAKPPLPKP